MTLSNVWSAMRDTCFGWGQPKSRTQPRKLLPSFHEGFAGPYHIDYQFAPIDPRLELGPVW
jgi:hypothetical protein